MPLTVVPKTASNSSNVTDLSERRKARSSPPPFSPWDAFTYKKGTSTTAPDGTITHVGPICYGLVLPEDAALLIEGQTSVDTDIKKSIIPEGATAIQWRDLPLRIKFYFKAARLVHPLG
jgi:hypothetical protein